MSIATVIVAALFSVMEARCRQPVSGPTQTPRATSTPAGRCSGSELRPGPQAGLAARWCLNAQANTNSILEVSSVNKSNTSCGTASLRLTSPTGKVYTNGPATQPGLAVQWERGWWSLVGTVNDNCAGKASWSVSWRG